MIKGDLRCVYTEGGGPKQIDYFKILRKRGGKSSATGMSREMRTLLDSDGSHKGGSKGATGLLRV